MVSGIVRSFMSLFWAILLLGFIMYLVAVCIMQVVRDELHQYKTGLAAGPSAADEAVLVDFYGSLLRTMYTLFQSVSGGKDWGESAAPLLQISGMLVTGFCVYVAFSVFCVLNVITGVFVDNAIKKTHRDEEHQRQLELDRRLRWFSEVQRLFNSVKRHWDDDPVDVPDLVGDIEAQIAFSQIGIEVDSLTADSLFKMLDFDGDGEVDIGEFIAGLEMYHGNARRMDIARLMREVKKLSNQLTPVLKQVEPAHNGVRPTSYDPR
eukprot:CAMPEP_0179341260 /NCGR_PEP_ID=MMETSP0797-20121207/69740_1 /TAXON_ID=47934 /ORGANISM="Dinophysis acuminata, Strain DAEP01" /LENGTH=263 /DNA_ID=CAMNT_0021055319 /DNA_START=1 /DNA_END=790 /DNA_ORIENTATION=+